MKTQVAIAVCLLTSCKSAPHGPNGPLNTQSAPAPVSNASFVAGVRQVTIGWDDSPEGVKVVIRRALDPTAPRTIQDGDSLCDPCVSPMTDTALGDGELVSYSLFAVAPDGEVSDPSSASVTTLSANDMGVTMPRPASSGLDARPANLACRAFAPAPPTGAAHFVDRFPAIRVDTPVGLFQRPGDNSRWYVNERAGRIVYFPNRPGVTQNDLHVAIDLRAVTFSNADCSMGSLAFPKDFATSGKAYIGYCYAGPETNGKLQLRYSRFTSHDNGDSFDPASEELIVTLDFPGDHDDPGMHSADVARFGADGFLYISLGDGGPFGRLGGNHGQDTFDLRGKLLRIDVSDLSLKLPNDGFVPDRRRVAAHYPADNPYVNGGGNPAVFAIGFRNPWQWHFDRLNGSLWVGDVGGSTWEEIDRVKKGGNYGWGDLEGSLCVNGHTAEECADPRFLPPFLLYHHGDGEQEGDAVSGGLVYRGKKVPSLNGAYIFGDSQSANIWAVKNVDAIPAGAQAMEKELVSQGVAVASFAEDQEGELWVAMLYHSAQFPAGHILALENVEPAAASSSGPPDLLSQTGCFDAADIAKPADDLIPYAPAATLWSDGATKRRWLVVPDGQRVTVKSDGDFDFPAGSVLVKEFSLGDKRIETRFLVRQTNDGQWAGYSYRWNDAESDATLVSALGEDRLVGDQTWTYPSRAQCSRCHTVVAGETLGLEIGQLNHPFTYPETGVTANQMTTLDAIGLLDLSAAPLTWPSYPRIDDESQPVVDRARGYLHANCSICHRPNGPTFTEPDFRFAPSFAQMNICGKKPAISALETHIVSDPLLFAPGAPDRSVFFVRMSTDDPTVRMPPLARTLRDDVAADVLARWITGVTQCP